MQRFLLVILVPLLIVGCSKPSKPLPPTNWFAKETSKKGSRAILSYADHNSRNKNIGKKYFLIAGGKDNANFAVEILEQKHFLISIGVPEEEISCFYTIPFDNELYVDEKRYRTLAEDLKKCYPAYPKYIWEQMADGGLKEEPLYLYVTSHGSLPMSLALKKYSYSPYQKKTIQSWISEFPDVDQFTIAVDALENGDPSNMENRVKELKLGKGSIEDLFFTPKNLKNALRRARNSSAQKYIVVQACYSGGFVDAAEEKYKKDTLRDIENVTVFTAAHYNRSSFGCNPGSLRTYFGGSYNDVFRSYKKLPEQLDWTRLYIDVTAKVKTMEEKYYQNLSSTAQKKFLNSDPMFLIR